MWAGDSGRPRGGDMAMGGPHTVLHPAPGQTLGLGVLERGCIQGSSQNLRAQALVKRRDGYRWR